MSEDEKVIDVERLIASKNPRLLKWTPKFLIRYLKRKLHEEDVNATLIANKGSLSFEFSKYIINRFNIQVKIEGIENVPKTGGVILALNHPLGGMDAMAIVTEFSPHREDYKFVVNDILLSIDNLKDMCVGVNKHGTNTKESLEVLNDLFASEKAVFLFPAGLVSRKRKGNIEDLDWKKTFITRSRKFERDVVPVHIDGELSKFFYRLSNFRTRIGIKANLEMLYLVDELYKQEDKVMRIRFGKPIPHSTFDKSKKDIEWAQWVKAKVYDLKGEN